MDLSQFVSGSIKQIIDGVMDAQKYALEKGARINPHAMTIKDSTAVITGYQEPETGQIIEFDVAVTIAEGSEMKGGLGISIASFGIGGSARSDASSSSISRLKFNIPVFLPVQPEKQ